MTPAERDVLDVLAGPRLSRRCSASKTRVGDSTPLASSRFHLSTSRTVAPKSPSPASTRRLREPGVSGVPHRLEEGALRPMWIATTLRMAASDRGRAVGQRPRVLRQKRGAGCWALVEGSRLRRSQLRFGGHGLTITPSRSACAVTSSNGGEPTIPAGGWPPASASAASAHRMASTWSTLGRRTDAHE
jgi:hypothetical protein